jgi:hypothetical protein
MRTSVIAGRACPELDSGTRNPVHAWHWIPDQVRDDNLEVRDDNGVVGMTAPSELLMKDYSMKNLQVFDPALCCSSGVCGTEVDQKLVTFSADVDWAKQNGARIERFNLAQQPLAFAGNAVVKGLLERSGEGALPVILLDGELALAGRYPSRDELARWAGIETALAPAAAGNCCSGGRCCG